MGKARAHHRHVAGVVIDPLGLLEGAIVLFVEHHQAQFAERQEQRGAGAYHHTRLPREHRAPGAGTLGRAHLGMPLGRPCPEPFREAIEKAVGERDFGQEDQRLPAGAQRVRHRLEKHLGLAAAGHPVEQRHAEPMRIEPPYVVQRLALFRAEAGRPRVEVGRLDQGGPRKADALDGSGFFQPLDHRC